MTNTQRTETLKAFREHVYFITGAYYPQLETFVEELLKERPLPTPTDDSVVEDWTEEQWNEFGVYFNLASEVEQANGIKRKLLASHHSKHKAEVEKAVREENHRIWRKVTKLAEFRCSDLSYMQGYTMACRDVLQALTNKES